MLVLDFIFCVSLEVCEDLLVFRCVIGKTFMGLRKISHAIEAYQGLGVDKDLVLRFGRWLHPKYLKKIRRRVRFSYVFTRSSLNVIDMSFSLYYDFFYKSLSDYFNKQDKRIYVFIASKKAVAGPPLGSLLAQYDIRVAEFCTRFNKRTEFLSSDIIVRVIIDWRYSRRQGLRFEIEKPSVSFFVGFFLDYYDSRGRYFPNGFVVFYDIVKIAMFKFPEIELKVSCRMVIGTVLSTGAGVRFRL